jgi:hypothetical protein
MSGEQISARGPKKKRLCRNCGAEYHSGKPAKCWLCEYDPASDPATAALSYDEDELRRRFQLPDQPRDNPAWIAVGFLAILLSLGLVTTGRGLLVVLLVVGLPVLIRVLAAIIRDSSAGRPMGGLQVVATFFSSVGIVALVSVVSLITFMVTFFATCIAICGSSQGGPRGISDDKLLQTCIIAGLIPGLLVAGLLFYWLWPRRG